MLKRVIATFFILLAVIAGSLYFFKKESVEEKPNIDLKTRINEFNPSYEEEEKGKKVKKIIIEKNINDSTKVVLFLQEHNGLGTAILENDTIKLVAQSSSDQQRYDQYKNYFIVYGKKPNKNNTELEITITRVDNGEEIVKTIALEEGEYFLGIGELPKDIEEFRIYSESFKYK